jgi:hypothetical protein
VRMDSCMPFGTCPDGLTHICGTAACP